MPTIAYLTNQFPSCLESYVAEEILELRRRGVVVIPCSAWQVRSCASKDAESWLEQTLYLQPLRWGLLLRALWTCCSRWDKLRDFWWRIFLTGLESPRRRLKAFLHTWLGAYFALLLEAHGVEHIHVHHGYFSAWIAMVAARLLGISYSMTLHGSDLLLQGAYLDLKLENCSACFAVSEYNLNYIRQHYPGTDERKLILRRLGVDAPLSELTQSRVRARDDTFILLSAGRLHRVKDHAFLLRGCAALHARGMPLLCLIAGEGPEKRRLTRQVKRLGLEGRVKLLGHLPRGELSRLYPRVDLVVLTSKSEGIPVVLMEAMAAGAPVLAPNITGIPELVMEGRTGFLYQPGSLEDFTAHVEFVRNSFGTLGVLRHAARQHVMANFHRQTNLRAFAEELLQHTCRHPEEALVSEESGAHKQGVGKHRQIDPAIT